MTGEIMLPHQWARRRFATCLDAAGCAAGATVAAADAAAGFSVGGAGVGAAGVADEQRYRVLDRSQHRSEHLDEIDQALAT